MIYYKCPKCGHNTNDDTDIVGVLDLYSDGERSRHCLKCYKKWISENVPEMEEV